MEGFYYIDKATKQQFGPFSPENLRGKVQPDTPVWKTGMADWTEARNVPELTFLFSATVQTPVPPVNNAQNQSYQNAAPRPQYPQFNQTANKTEVRPMPDNWLILSILATIFCCLPFGIVGIINATKVESLYYAGDYEGAVNAANNAKKWTIISAVSIVVILILYFLLIFGLGMSGLMLS